MTRNTNLGEEQDEEQDEKTRSSSKMKIPNYDCQDPITNFKQLHPFMPDRTLRMLICGPSGSGKTNVLLDMIFRLLFYDKIYLYAKNLDQINIC